MACIIVRCRWCNIIVLSAQAKREKKVMFQKRFYAELKQVFDHFPVYNIELLVGDFNANCGEGIFAN
jgi:hypothetical protein